MSNKLKFELSDNAVQHISAILASEPKGSFFRIAVKGGGCSGFSYIFKIDTLKDATDLTYSKNGCDVVIDGMSIAFLKDSVLDYVVELSGSQFEIKNPNAKSSCGCGVSFAI